MSSQDRDYYAKREQQEREHAERSADDSVRRAHLTMAERYRSLISETEAARA